MSSLSFFKPCFMSITSPHPLFTTAGSSPSKVAMASIQAVMASGRYRTEALCSHWSANKRGTCQLSEACSEMLEDVPHILSTCSALNPTRDKLLSYTREYSSVIPHEIRALLLLLCSPSHNKFCSFLLDCSTLPEVISASQRFGYIVLEHFYNVTRTWIFVLHRERLRILGRWKPY